MFSFLTRVEAMNGSVGLKLMQVVREGNLAELRKLVHGVGEHILLVGTLD